MSNKLDLAKYKKLAKYLQVVIKVFYVVSIVCIIVALVAGIFITITPAASLGMIAGTGGSVSLSIDNVFMFKVAPEYATGENFKPIFASICFIGITIGVMLAVIFKQLELILGTVKNDRPFAPENSRRLIIIGATLMIGAFIKRIGECIVAYTIINTLKLFDVSVNYSADSSMLIMGFVVLILAGVFKYGSFLQNEYDSTV